MTCPYCSFRIADNAIDFGIVACKGCGTPVNTAGTLYKRAVMQKAVNRLKQPERVKLKFQTIKGSARISRDKIREAA